MHPLDRAISDLRDVEDFITNRELDSDGALLLFEEITKKMLADVNIGSHNLSGEASTGHLPRNVMEDLKVSSNIPGLFLTDIFGCFSRVDC